MLSALVTFFLVGLATVVGLGIALALIGIVFSVVLSLAGFLLFKVAPIVLIGYLVVKFLAPRKRRLAAADSAEWIDGG
ncbi:MAG TPA: hypothetical protein VNZ57_01895 [Longimicrobiales bacterium]|nr:hypothetical protein [Longimicrobiales bacterium]